jgi:hypothetical protein
METNILWAFVVAMGIPSAITGLLVWWLKKHIDEREKKNEAREKNTEKLMLLLVRTGRATNVLAEATAKAVQRIPDAKCNGDMTKALERAKEMQEQERDFMFELGIEHMFRD